MNKRTKPAFAHNISCFIYLLLSAFFIAGMAAPLIAGTASISEVSIPSGDTILQLKSGGKIQTGLSFDLISVITVVGIIQGFFLAFLLFKIRPGKNRANIILALFLIVLSLNIVYDVYFFSGMFYKVPEFSFVGETYPFVFLICPLLYFYVINLTMPSFRFKPVHLLHMLPSFISILIVIQQSLTVSADEIRRFWISYINNTSFQLSVLDIFLTIVVAVQVGTYLVVTLLLLAKHEKRIKELFSSIEHRNLLWLNYIVHFILLIYIFLIISHIYWFWGGSYGWFYTQRVYPVLVTIFIFAFGYKGLTQPEIFTGVTDAAGENSDSPDEKKSISGAKISEIMHKLNLLMEERKPYLDPELTLPMLADMLEVPRNYLSQVINEDLKQNFFDFINTYRVKTAREYLEDHEKQNLNILNIAFDAGFNSKTTFNVVFKKCTGLTPSEYKKTVQKN